MRRLKEYKDNASEVRSVLFFQLHRQGRAFYQPPLFYLLLSSYYFALFDMKVISKLVPPLAAALYVSAHGVITDVFGANGLRGVGFGVVSTITTLDQFQQESSIINDNEIAGRLTGICGRTLGGGVIDVQAMLAGIASTAGLPTAFPDGSVNMKLFQPGTDGAGPYTCEVSPSATGEDFAEMVVSMDVLRRFNAETITFSLIAQIPKGMTCTGGPNANACLIRCRNSAIGGPFGGCAAVTTVDSGGALGAAPENDVVFDANGAPDVVVPPEGVTSVSAAAVAVPSTSAPARPLAIRPLAARPLASARPLAVRPLAIRPPAPPPFAARPPPAAAGPAFGAVLPPPGVVRPPAGGRPLANAATRPTLVGALPGRRPNLPVPGSRARPSFSRRRHSRK